MRRLGSIGVLLVILVHLASCAPPTYQGNQPAGGAGGGQPPQAPQSTSVPLPGSPSGGQVQTAAPATGNQAQQVPTEVPWWAPPSNAAPDPCAERYATGPLGIPLPPSYSGNGEDEQFKEEVQSFNDCSRTFYAGVPFFGMSKAEQEAILAQQAEQLLLAAGQTLEGFDTPEEIIEKVRGLFENIPVPVPADGSGTEQPPGSGQTVSSQGIVCPVNVPGRIVMTQGYGVGSHVPAQVFGAIDLAVDGDGDGAADVPGTHRAPLVAAFDGVVYAVTEEHNGNRYVSIKNADGRRFAYSHLDEYIVSSGQVVVRGQQIGYIGDTGYSFGDHLDIQYWVPNGSGGEVNTDPTAMLREACGFP